MGMSPDEIIYHHPTITLADVYAALAYYHDNREEIRRQLEAGETFAKQLQDNKPSLIEKILNWRAKIVTKKLRVYIDTSVIGGCLDDEFSLESNQLMEAIKQEKFILLMSDIIVSKLIIAFPNLMRYTKILTPDSSKPKTLYLTTMGIAISKLLTI